VRICHHRTAKKKWCHMEIESEEKDKDYKKWVSVSGQ
jgi:hypothetical protein